MQKNEYLIAKIGVDAAENKFKPVSKDWAACNLPRTPPWVEQRAMITVGTGVGSSVTVGAGVGYTVGCTVGHLTPQESQSDPD